jgi:hypothetical protein
MIIMQLNLGLIVRDKEENVQMISPKNIKVNEDA